MPLRSNDVNPIVFPYVSNELVYSPANVYLDELFQKFNEYVEPYLSVRSEKNSRSLESRLLKNDSFVGVEFPDWYWVSYF